MLISKRSSLRSKERSFLSKIMSALCGNLIRTLTRSERPSDRSTAPAYTSKTSCQSSKKFSAAETNNQRNLKMKIMIAFPTDGKSESVSHQMLQLIQQFYQLQMAPEPVQFLSGYFPVSQISGETRNKSLAQCAQLYAQLAQADRVVFVGSWTKDSICSLLKSACEEYKIPHFAQYEFRDGAPVIG